MDTRKYVGIVSFCEELLATHGDNLRGVGFTRSQNVADACYQVMLEVIRHAVGEKKTVLDFGCGVSHLYDYIKRRGLDHVDYSGLDLSEKYLAISRNKYPSVAYYQADVLKDDVQIPSFDYIILQGIFNYKGIMTQQEMLDYFHAIVSRVFGLAHIGICFNVMSKQVDWEREDLFHLPMDDLASFLVKKISRNFIIRHDYGLYEYTTYVYR